MQLPPQIYTSIKQADRDEIFTLLAIASKSHKWIRKKATSDGSPTLSGYCAIASCFIFNKIEQRLFKPLIKNTLSHVWVEYENIVIDVTASQFGKCDIILADKNDYLEYMNITDSIYTQTSINELIDFQWRVDWKINQIPKH